MEEFDKRIANTVRINLEQRMALMYDAFQRVMSLIDEAESIGEVMSAKRDLMVQIVKNVPTNDDTCYFCIYHRDRIQSCDECTYSKTHGRRCTGTWRKLVALKWALVDFIQSEYWTGGEMIEHKGHKTNSS